MRWFALAALAAMAFATLWYVTRPQPAYVARYPLPPEDEDGVTWA